MNDNRRKIIESLIRLIPELTSGQLHWIQRIVSVYSADHKFILNKSEFLDEATLQNFGDAIRVHHSFSSEPFSKDKFEYVFVNVLNLSGHQAALAPRGNPGHDITIDTIKLSLKTQADKNIKENILWISKFMELGKGKWGNNPDDLEGLRKQFLRHLENYERILILRAIQKAPTWKYELVEIPIDVLKLALEGELEMKIESKQFPKPGYCYVRDQQKKRVFDLYFDGGSERKLQIKNLDKRYCHVHAKWEFFIPKE
ncbi:MAG: restriction endonuclease [Cyanobacteria bacterium P01_G01_bin.54]